MLEIRNITKKYTKGEDIFIAIEDVSCVLGKGDFLSVTGPSGSGKSTLLNIIGGLIRPDAGTVMFEGGNVYQGSEKQLAHYRKENIGFVFQQFHLLPYLTLFQNIKLGCHNPSQCLRIEALLEKCLLSSLKNKFPSELSVGERQRTAFVRAIISEPVLLLADEPTGNLDPDNSNVLMSLIQEFNSSGGSVIVASHDLRIAELADRHLRLQSGRVVIP
ncbi:MAG TPA: ABC transporter ATP-binding protein [Bacteroidales bacterium]|nr:ABC transporter ATP-binding protein [Bacteroidales bacterium]HPF04010.1 ABC transporter ATP-binding protein [Bacteroidales bacterium]HPJ58339.1 ABC transporter ATP-binding protein [Bacteroidales bacterium]HPR10855.1 ABC transporter ATP-binding protein [Bacteroidales bacterium]HRW84185.1 ABC transporter ATP-binding protein [Bacteroidales bacterium]